MMKLIMSAFVVCGLVVTAWPSGQAWAEDGKIARIYTNVPIFRGGDYGEFTNEMRQTREQVRGQLEKEFGDIMAPLIGSTQDMVGLVGAIQDMIVKFDGLYREHREEAHDRISASLETSLKGGLDEVFRRYQLPESERKVQFVGRKQLSQLDYVAYGGYTVLRGGAVTVTVSLQQIRDGATRSFTAAAPVDEVMTLIAEQIFQYFQASQFPEWINPQPKLKWIPQPAPAQRVTANIAKMACASQGARLPFSRELIQASMATEYRSGGIVRLQDFEHYVVADRQREEAPYYYKAGPEAAAVTGGPVHTDGAYGTINAYFWCVKGSPSAAIVATESLYRLLRKTIGRPELKRTEEALEYLLISVDDFGARSWYGKTFRDADEAVAYLRSQGYFVELP